MSNNKGFTLAELLIVVAIIGVLTAIAIPVFSSQLEKSREATDIANMRAAKAAAVAKYLDNNEAGDADGIDYYFDAQKGTLVTSATGVVGYGKGTAKDGGCEDFYKGNNASYTATDAVAGQVLKVTIVDTDSADNVVLTWQAAE